MSRRLASTAFALVLLGACQVPAPQPPEPRSSDPMVNSAASGPMTVPTRLRMGLLPVFSPEEMITEYQPLADHLSAKLGSRIEIHVPATYDELIEELAQGQLDFVQLAPLAYVKAKRRIPDLIPLVSDLLEGSPSYSGYLLARWDTEIRRPADLWGKRFGFVNRSSTSGYLYPLAFLVELGFRPGRDWSSAVFYERHDRVITRLLAGDIDVGASYSGALSEAINRGLDVSKLAIVAKTGRIPLNAWCAREHLDRALAMQLRAKLMELGGRGPTARKVLPRRQLVTGFTTIQDSDYDDVRRVLGRIEGRFQLDVPTELDAGPP